MKRLLCWSMMVSCVACQASRVERVIRLQATPGLQLLAPYELLLDEANGRLSVLSQSSSNVVVYDTRAGRLAGPLPLHPDPLDTHVCLCGRPHQISIAGRGRELYLAIATDLWLLDPVTPRVRAHRSWPDAGVISMARGPEALCALVANKDYCWLMLLDPATLASRGEETPHLRLPDYEARGLHWGSKVLWDPQRRAFIVCNPVPAERPSPWVVPPPGFPGLALEPNSGLSWPAEGPEVAVPEAPASELLFRVDGDGPAKQLQWADWQAPDKPLGRIALPVTATDGPYDEVLAAAWDPSRRRAVLAVDGDRGISLAVVNLSARKVTGRALVSTFVDHDEDPDVPLRVDWGRGRVYAVLDSSLLVCSADTARVLHRYPLGSWVSAAGFDAAHGLLSVVGARDTYLAWVIDSDLRLRTVASGPNREWLAYDAARDLVYTNIPSIDGSDGRYALDRKTGRQVDAVGDDSDGVLSRPALARHPLLDERAADPKTGRLWQLAGRALRAYVPGAAVPVTTIPLPAVGSLLRLDPARRLAYVCEDRRETDDDSWRVYRCGLDDGQVAVLSDLDRDYRDFAACPWGGLAALHAAGHLALLTPEGKVSERAALPTPAELGGLGRPFDGYYCRVLADHNRGRLFVVDQEAAAVVVVSRGPQ